MCMELNISNNDVNNITVETLMGEIPQKIILYFDGYWVWVSTEGKASVELNMLDLSNEIALDTYIDFNINASTLLESFVEYRLNNKNKM